MGNRRERIWDVTSLTLTHLVEHPVERFVMQYVIRAPRERLGALRIDQTKHGHQACDHCKRALRDHVLRTKPLRLACP